MIKILLAFAVSCFAGEFGDSLAREPHDQAIYFHPTITYLTLQLSDSVPIAVYLTYEKELENGKSLTVEPALAVGNLKTDGEDGQAPPPMAKIFSIGVNVGYRNYFNGQVSHDFYGAPVLAVAYAHLTRKGATVSGGTYAPVSLDAYSAGLMGAIGFRGKWRVFTLYTDGAIGWQFAAISGSKGTGGVTGSGLLYDLNVGLGIPF